MSFCGDLVRLYILCLVCSSRRAYTFTRGCEDSFAPAGQGALRDWSQSRVDRALVRTLDARL
jgi:hypothetical protein